ncbi:hypothetical protein RHSIM_Rhsim01G0079400 [Rhododendron simsii]|uniref:Uncharacterized protein n=1 Tax=Rhododendron simsii TaxID=118357 RepID=A0A834M1D6_RHOSS|nr:hypothetical protein RHSIM_Rhsim01G0079400 [Rhododendron simsii]
MGMEACKQQMLIAHRHAESFTIITTEIAQAFIEVCLSVPKFSVLCKHVKHGEEQCMIAHFFVLFYCFVFKTTVVTCNVLHQTIYKTKELKELFVKQITLPRSRVCEWGRPLILRRSSVEEENGLLERCWGVYDAVLGSFFCFPA